MNIVLVHVLSIQGQVRIIDCSLITGLYSCSSYDLDGMMYGNKQEHQTALNRKMCLKNK